MRSSRRASRFSAALVLAASLVTQLARASDAPPKAEDSIATADGGFVLHQPKWKKDGAGENTGLVVTYSWGGVGGRKARVSDAIGYWELTFPDRPKPNEAATLELAFEFAVSDKDRAAAIAAAEAMVAEAIALVQRSADEAAAAPGVTSFSDEVVRRVGLGMKSVLAKAGVLETMRTSDGKSGVDVVLEELGFRKTAAADWELPGLAAAKLYELASLRAGLEIGPRRAKVTQVAQTARLASPLPFETGSAPCKTAVTAALAGTGDDVAGLKTCLAWTSAIWHAEIARLGAGPAPDSAALAALAAALATVDPQIANLKAEDVNAAPAAGNAKFYNDLLLVTDNADAIHANSYSVSAVVYLRNKIALANAERKFKELAIEPVTKRLALRIATLKQEHIGSALLEQGADKRLYQAATGVVYVARLDQVIMPLMISYCVYDGCLRRGKTIFDGGEVKHLFSVDLGMRAKTVGEGDQRDQGALGFIAGGSLNPLLFVRFSIGAYFFENSQTKNWNAVPYVGATADLLHAAELLGVTGLGIPQPPSVISTSAASPNNQKGQ